MSTPAAPILALQGVGKSYPGAAGPVPVLHGVDLAVAGGEFLAITGPSGSGKTTLLNLVALLDRPSAGRILFEGRDVALLDDAQQAALRKTRMGMVVQDFHLLVHRSVLENVLFRFRYVATPRREALALARQALARVGLAVLADQPARLLSGGEMQRVAIARAIALPPRLLLADEPTGNLDAATAEQIMEHFCALHAAGITLLLVTHNPALLRYTRRRLVCRDGTLQAAPEPG